MKLTGTHTLATLEISQTAHSEIWNLLERANYEHALDREGRQIDMTGIALTPAQGIEAEVVRSADDLIKTAAILADLTPEQLVELSKRLENDRSPMVIEAESSIPTTMKSYRHHRGGTYTVLAVARSSEARDELLAVYTSHQTQQVWVRPWSMFNEIVEWPDGVRRPRFVEMPTLAQREALARVARVPTASERLEQDLLCKECGHPAASHSRDMGACTDCDKCTGYE